jgi:hypothetical protein
MSTYIHNVRLSAAENLSRRRMASASSYSPCRMTYDIDIYRVHEWPSQSRGARESLPGRLLGLEELAAVNLWGMEIGALLPGHVDLHVTPDSRIGVQFRTMGGRNTRCTFIGRWGLGGIWVPLPSGTRRFKRSRKACAKASTQSWKSSACRYDNASLRWPPFMYRCGRCSVSGGPSAPAPSDWAWAYDGGAVSPDPDVARGQRAE